MRLLPCRAALFALVLVATTAAAQTPYPSQPIKLIVPYPAGSLVDVLGRAIGETLSASLKQPVVVDNRAGASTLIGAKSVASAQPDGYTLLIPTVTTLSIAPQLVAKPGVDPLADFTPIARLGATSFFLSVHPSFPARTMAEWIAEIKKHPGKYTYASAGNGTPHHIFMELLKTQLGLDIVHVPYKGSSSAMTDLLTGRVDMAFLDGTLAIPNIKSGKAVRRRTVDCQAQRAAAGGPADRRDRARFRLERLDRGRRPRQYACACRQTARGRNPHHAGDAAIRQPVERGGDGADRSDLAGGNGRVRAQRIRALGTRDQGFGRHRRMITRE